MQIIMPEAVLLQTYKTLPIQLKQEVADFVEFVKMKYQNSLTETTNSLTKNRKRTLGVFPKGTFVMSEDFNEPMDEVFKDYL